MSSVTTQPRSISGGVVIVVGLAFNEADGPAFDQAARIARRVPASTLHLVHVFDRDLSAARSRDLIDHLRLYVNEKAAVSDGLAGVTVGIHLRSGKVVREIIQLATEVDADIIAVGSDRGPHFKHWLVGSTAEDLMVAASCPVLVAGPQPKEPEKQEPTIEPPCPNCVRQRTVSRGLRWWCERHAHQVNAGHTFSYQREIPLASHDSSVIPTGIDF
jgi:nucleotide-binding universal stress UspA family protein